MGETSEQIDRNTVLSERTERAGAVAKAGGLEQALGSGALPRFQNITLSEAVVLGLLRQGVRRFLWPSGVGGHLGSSLRIQLFGVCA